MGLLPVAQAQVGSPSAFTVGKLWGGTAPSELGPDPAEP